MTGRRPPAPRAPHRSDRLGWDERTTLAGVLAASRPLARAGHRLAGVAGDAEVLAAAVGAAGGTGLYVVDNRGKAHATFA